MKFFLILVIGLVISCSSKNDNSVIDLSKTAKVGGWAGVPDSPNKKPYDYFYLLQKGNVKSKQVKPEQMEKACVDSVRKDGARNIVSNLVLFALLPVSDITETFEEYSTKFMLNDFKIKKIKMEVKNCIPTIPNPKWKECECLTYIHVIGGLDYVYETIRELERL